MGDVELSIGFFEEVISSSTDEKSDFIGHFAAGVVAPNRADDLGSFTCVLFGRVREKDEVSYKVELAVLREDRSLDEVNYEEGVVTRQEKVEVEWTFQLILGFSDISYSSDFIIRVSAEVDGAHSTAHLRVAPSDQELNKLGKIILERRVVDQK